MKRLPIILCCTLLTACSDDDMQIGDIFVATDNPAVYIYIEDADGNDLLEGGEPVSISGIETGEQIAYDLHRGQRLPWGETGTLLAFQPATPYHDPNDGDYVFTTDPHTAVCIGSNDAIVLHRSFGCRSVRHAVSGGRQDISVSYSPDYTTICGYTTKGDTLHVIMESGSPNLRVEGKMLTVEMRFPVVADSLAALPLMKDAEGKWENELLRFRLLFSGRSISKPRETVTTALCTERVPDADGCQYGDTFTAVTISLPLPCIYAFNNIDYLEGFVASNYDYDYLVSSPILFGDDREHSFSLSAFDLYGNVMLRYTSIRKDGIHEDAPTFAAANHLIVDWRE